MSFLSSFENNGQETPSSAKHLSRIAKEFDHLLSLPVEFRSTSSPFVVGSRQTYFPRNAPTRILKDDPLDTPKTSPFELRDKKQLPASQTRQRIKEIINQRMSEDDCSSEKTRLPNSDLALSNNYIGQAAVKSFYNLYSEVERHRLVASLAPSQDIESVDLVAEENCTPRHAYLTSLSRRPALDKLVPIPICLRKENVRGMVNSEKSINLAHHALGDEYISLLSKTLPKMTDLQSLNLRENRLTDRSLHPIIAAITSGTGCREITRLDLSQNKLDRLAISQLANYLINPSCLLEDLSLSQADIDDLECEQIAKALETNTSVKRLDLSHNKIGGTREMLAASALGLGHDTSQAHYLIQATISESNGMNCAGIALGKALRVNKSMETLDISWNQLGRISGIELGDSLKTNNTLSNLIASYNSIGDAGAQLLGQSLRSNAALTRLDLSRNDIGNRGASVLAGALHVNSRLVHIFLDENPIGRLGGRAIFGTWNFAVKERFIQMRNCKFDVVDRSSAFDPSSPGGEYLLSLDDPLQGSYNTYVAQELLRLATVRNGCAIQSLRWNTKSQTAPVEVLLERSRDIQPPSQTRNIGKALWRRAKHKFRRKFHFFSTLTARESRDAIGRFRLIEQTTQQIWSVPTEGELRITFTSTPALPSELEVVNQTGLAGLRDMMLTSPLERMIFLELISADVYFTCDQIFNLIDMINATTIPFTGEELNTLFKILIPRILDFESLHFLLSTYLSFPQQRILMNTQDELLLLCGGAVNGYYRLDLSKDVDVTIIQRLAAISAAERRYNRTHRPESGDESLMATRGTSERGKWSSFRNPVCSHKPITEGQLEALLRRRMQRNHSSEYHILSFDFVSTTRPPLSAHPVSDDHLKNVLTLLGIFDLSEMSKSLKLNHQKLLLEGLRLDPSQRIAQNCLVREQYIEQCAVKDIRYAQRWHLDPDPELSQITLSTRSELLRWLQERGVETVDMSEQNLETTLRLIKNQQLALLDTHSRKGGCSCRQVIRYICVRIREHRGNRVLVVRSKRNKARVDTQPFGAENANFRTPKSPTLQPKSSTQKKPLSQSQSRGKTSKKKRRKWQDDMNQELLSKLQARLKAINHKNRLVVMWQRWDKNSSGHLDFNEFRRLVRIELRVPVADISDSELGKLFVILDADSSGELSLNELEDFIHRGPKIFEGFSMKAPTNGDMDVDIDDVYKIEGGEESPQSEYEDYQLCWVPTCLPVDPSSGRLPLGVAHCAKLFVHNTLAHLDLKSTDIRVLEHCKRTLREVPVAGLVPGIDTQCDVFYCDVFVPKWPSSFETEGPDGPWLWSSLHLHLAQEVPLQMSQSSRHMMEVRFRFGEIWLTCTQVCTVVRRAQAFFSQPLLEDLIVSLFGRTVDVENWKEVLSLVEELETQCSPKEQKPQGRNTFVSRRMSTLNTATQSSSTMLLLPPTIPASPTIIELERRLGWLNMLNPVDIEDIRFDLDLAQYEDWFVARVLARLSFVEDGVNFKEPQYRRHSPMWSPGWGLPESWDEVDYQGNSEAGIPREGELIVTYTSHSSNRDIDVRTQFQRNCFLCGMPRPKRPISALENDFHLYSKYELPSD